MMRSKGLFGVVMIGLLLSAVCVKSANAQAVYGSVIGTVTDPQGNAVVGAKVVVTSTTKNFAFDTTSNESGNYAVTHLIPDNYRVRVEATGFKAFDAPNVRVDADSSAHVDAQLQVGAVTQTVEVTGEIPQLKTDRADVDISFNETYVSELPVLNRNFTNFELLSPGTQKLVGWSHAATENPQGGGQIFANGQHFSGTNFELDGTDNQDPILGIIVVNPNLDAIGEAKIAMQDYDAESGKATAGVVKVQTKSGSNALHGGGFFFYRNSEQQARDPFTNAPGVPLAPATWKQYGGNAGGPIIKDKLFFFADYQGTNQIQGITNQYSTPTALVLSSCNPATNPSGNCDLSEYLNAYGPPVNGVASGQIYQPGTYVGNGSATCPTTPTVQQTQSALLSGSCRAPFAGNLIPMSLITSLNPNIGKVLSLFPAPTSSGVNNNFVSTGSGPFNQKSMDARIDYSAPRNYQVFTRFSLDYFSLSGKGGLGALGGNGFGPGGLNGSSIVHNYSLASGFTKPIGSKWLTDVRFGYFKYNPQTAYSDASATPMTTFGFPGLNISGSTATNGLSSFFFGGNGSLSAFGDGLNVGRCNCPLTESEQQFQFVNNWTRTQGNHTIKFGADIRYAMNLRVPSDQNRAGVLNFDAGGTSLSGNNGLGLATFLLGDVTSFQRYVSTILTAAERQKRTFFYGQDSWRISPKFTMTYGLRWEIYSPENVNGKGNGGFANQVQGVINVAGYGGVNMSGNVANTYKAFAPRLSFAYTFDPKTVLRIGYGRGFDIGVFGSNFGHVVTQNLPVLGRQNLADSNLNSAASNNRSAVFTLAQGPPAFDFTSILSQISSGGTLPLAGLDGATQANTRPTLQRLPTIDQWNATVQRQVTQTLNLTVSYIGNKGTHVFAGTGPSYNSNEVAVGPGTNPVVCPTPTTCALGGFTPAQSQADRRYFYLNGVPAFNYPGFYYIGPGGAHIPTPACCAVDLSYYGNDANNNYNALQVKAEKRVSNGLQFIAHYTFSHAYAYDSGYYSVNKTYAYGPNPDNRNHVFVINTVYELPIGKGKKYMGGAGRAEDLLIGGWQLTNTLNWSGGLPWTPSIGECSALTDAGPCRPNALGTGRLTTGKIRGSDGNLYWFTPVPALSYGGQISSANVGVDSCTFARVSSGPFSLPACGQIGNAGIFSYRGPHGFYSDMAMSKNFTITERVKAQFRFDAYNVFNHPVLGFNGSQGNTCVDCGGNAGQITDIENDNSPGSPSGMRQLQFGFKVTF